jgi:hypothetical protein
MATLKAKISTAFLYFTPGNKTILGAHVIDEVGAHPLVFATPDPSIAAMTTANNNLITAIANAESGDEEMIALRNAAEAAWDTVFIGEADYVNGIAKGNAVIIVQSGFDSTKTETASHPLPGFTTIKSIVGNVLQTGTIKFECGQTPFATGYLYIGVTGGGSLNFNILNNTIVVETNNESPGPVIPAKIVIGISTHSTYILGSFQKGAHVNCGVIPFNAKGLGGASGYQEIIAP